MSKKPTHENRQPLATTYRPRTWDDVAGQDNVVSRLKGILSSGKIPNAILFRGPSGTGKTSLSRVLSRYINCENDTSCGECDSCRAMDRDQHPDYIELNCAEARGIDDIRQIIQQVNFVPQMGNMRIFMMDEIQMLTPSAAAAILKTLEEPPSHALFILATMEPDKVIPAIHGRCQQMDLQRVSAEDITERLQEICKELKEKRISKDNLTAIAHQTGGQVRDAVQALEAVVQYLDGTNSKGSDIDEVVGEFLKSSMAADDQVAIKSLVWLYAQFQETGSGKTPKRTATLKKMLGTLMDTNNAVTVANNLLSLNSYLISCACNDKHKNVWHTSNNTTFKNLLNKNVPWRDNFGTNPYLPAALAVQSHLLELRRDLVTLNTSEIAQIQTHLGKAFMAVTEFLPD